MTERFLAAHETSVRPALWIAALIAGCATRRETPSRRSADLSSAVAGEARVTGVKPGATRPTSNPEAELLKLEAYEVRESAFSDFGMSVKTNFEVQWGGQITWMSVSGIEAGSSAARMGLAVGDKILAVDARPITEMDRAAMLAALFQRKKGERSRVLILARGEALPRFLILNASRPERVP